MIKRLIASMIMLVFVGSLVAGCSSGDDAATTTDEQETEQTEANTADTNSEENGIDNEAELNAMNDVFPANYQAVTSDYEVDSDIGKVLFAAEGETSDGANVLGVKVESAKKLNYEGTARTGWDASEPKPFTMIIVVDKDHNKVVAWEMVEDGTKEPEFFTVPEEKINSYMNVELTSENVFDEFTEGLVFDMDVEKDTDSDGNTIIAGSSIVYTGASEAGTFSSQHVRHCFRTAAYFYSNY